MPARPGVRHAGSPVPLRRSGASPTWPRSWARTGCSSGRPSIRPTRSTFGWPDLVPITDLAGANRALERIVEQGEGATGDWRTAHYGRFLGGARPSTWRCASPDAGFEPTHPVVGAGMRAVEGIEPDVYITDPDTGGLLGPVQRRVRADAADDRALLRLRPRDARAAPGPGQRRRRPHVRRHQAAGPSAGPPARGTRAPRCHGGCQLPAALPVELPAPAPPRRRGSASPSASTSSPSSRPASIRPREKTWWRRCQRRWGGWPWT